MTDEKKDELILSVIENIKAIKKEAGEIWDEAKELNLFGVINEFGDVVHAIESLGKKLNMSGAEKKELAVYYINGKFDIKWVPESLEAKLIGFGIDIAVAVLNKKLGKDWLVKL